MLTRRQMLSGAALVPAAAGLAPARAWAFSAEPMIPADAAAMNLACGAAVSHADLVARARLWLDDEVGRGLLPAGYGATIHCPFCRCSLRVTSGDAF